MTHSKIHQAFSERLKQPEALTNPGKYLGPNWEDVLNFWIYVETLSEQEKQEMRQRYWALDDYVQNSAVFAACDAAEEVVGEKFRRAASRAVYVVTGESVFGWATLELIGRHKRNTHLALSLTGFSVTKPISEVVSTTTKISKTHQRFSDYLERPDILTNPEKYLGPNYQDVLNFWIYVDGLSDQEKEAISDRYWALDSKVRNSAWVAASNVAIEVVGEKFSDAAWRAAYDVTGWRLVFGYATYELIGRHKRNTHLALSLTNFSVTDPIDEALIRLHEYSIAHPDHDTDEIVKRAKEFKAKVL
jgi:hypothetical protein